MRLLMVLLLVLSGSAFGEEICVERSEFQSAVLQTEFLAENKARVLHNMEKIDLVVSFVGVLNGQGEQEQYEAYDNMVNVYLSTIVLVLDYAKKQGAEIEIYANRLSEDLTNIADKSEYFPQSIGSGAYQRLVAEVSKL